MARINIKEIKKLKDIYENYQNYQTLFTILESKINYINDSIELQFSIDNDMGTTDQNITEGYVLQRKTDEYRKKLENDFVDCGYQYTNDFVSALINSFYIIDTNLDPINFDINLTHDYFLEYAHNYLRICSTFENRDIDISYTINSGLHIDVISKITGSVPFMSYDLMYIMNKGHNGFKIYAKNNEQGYLSIGSSPYNPSNPLNTIIRDPNGNTSVDIPPREGVHIFENANNYLEENVYEDFADYLYYMNMAINYKNLVETSFIDFRPEINDIIDKINLIYKTLANIKVKN